MSDIIALSLRKGRRNCELTSLLLEHPFQGSDCSDMWINLVIYLNERMDGGVAD